MSQIKEKIEKADFKEESRNLCSAKLLKALTKIFNTAFAASIDIKNISYSGYTYTFGFLLLFFQPLFACLFFYNFYISFSFYIICFGTPKFVESILSVGIAIMCNKKLFMDMSIQRVH